MIEKSTAREMVRRLNHVERRCQQKRNRFQFYGYLVAVYECYVRLRRTKESRKAASLVASMFELPTKHKAHPIRVLIDASSSADNKTKSRWTQALRYVWHTRREGLSCLDVLKMNGGPAGCAEKFAALTPRVPKGYWSYGGPGLPHVPLYIHEDCIGSRGGRIA